MPRKYSPGRQSKDIGQRFNRGITSGVTLVTVPSGSTVANAGITTPLLTVASIINSTNSGYPVTGLTDGIMVVSGSTTTKGGVSQVFTAAGGGSGQQFGLGMTSIVAMKVTAKHLAGTSPAMLSVANYSDGASVTVFYNNHSGSSYNTKTLLEFLAIGT